MQFTISGTNATKSIQQIVIVTNVLFDEDKITPKYRHNKLESLKGDIILLLEQYFKPNEIEMP